MVGRSSAFVAAAGHANAFNVVALGLGERGRAFTGSFRHSYALFDAASAAEVMEVLP
jgi:hypothetical protein